MARREYETLYIIVPELDEEAQQKLMDALVEQITRNGGEIVKHDVWGRRRLAYPIKKKTDGVYVLLRYSAEPLVPRELDVFIKRTPDVLRHLTTVVSKQQFKEEARLRAEQAKKEEEARIAAEEAAKREAEAAAAAEEAAAEEAAQPTATADQENTNEPPVPAVDNPALPIQPNSSTPEVAEEKATE